MRVLHLCWSYPSEWFPEEGSFFRNMVEPLCATGIEALVATPVPYFPAADFLGRLVPRLKRFAKLPRSYEYNGVRVRVPRYARFPRAVDGRLLPVQLASAVASAADWKPDIVHAHFAYPYGAAALRLRRRWRVPVVLTIHGNDGNFEPYRSEAGRRRFVDAVCGADQVLAVSNDLACRSHELSGRIAQFWPIGIDLDWFRRRTEEKAAIRRELGLPVDKKLLLFVGSFIERKGVDQFPALMERLQPQALAVMVGDGHLRPQICNSPRCIWIPPVPNSRLIDYLSATDLMVLPAEREGTPTVLVEAGAAHLPVVANAVSGIPDLLANDRGLVTEPHNMDSLVGAVEAVLRDPVAAERRSERLYAYVAVHYDCKTNARKLKQLYEGLVRDAVSSIAQVNGDAMSATHATTSGGHD